MSSFTRKLSTWPLPGGVTSYLDRLNRLLQHIGEEQPTLSALADWAAKTFQVNANWMPNAVRTTIIYAGLAEISEGRLRLTETGKQYIETKDKRIVLDGFLDGVWGVREVFQRLQEKPMNKTEIAENLIKLGAPWKYKPMPSNQFGYRTDWLEALGCVRQDRGRYELTEYGRAIADELWQQGLRPEPRSVSHGPGELMPAPSRTKEAITERVDKGRTISAELLKKGWLDLTQDDLEKIVTDVVGKNEQRLEIDASLIERILRHLILGKNVILVGPPGTGKTDLAIRMLSEIGKIVTSSSEPVVAVASYEWGRYEVIGGNSIHQDESGELFHLGCVTKAIKEKRLLLIDEFNRADMNKAFGEMFLAIEHSKTELRADENPNWLSAAEKQSKSINISPEFRMICTMNDFDKSLLNELSYGLLRRFAFVEIDVPEKEKEKAVVLERVQKQLTQSNQFGRLNFTELTNNSHEAINSYFDFMNKLRERRKIGVSTSIDVIKYMLYHTSFQVTQPNDKTWAMLDQALVDYVLPQLDRLDTETIRHAKESIRTTLSEPAGGPRVGKFSEHINKTLSRLEDLDKLFAPEQAR